MARLKSWQIFRNPPQPQPHDRHRQSRPHPGEATLKSSLCRQLANGLRVARSIATVPRMPPHPVRHHFVPQFLLKYFAGQGGQLYVHQWASGRAFQRNVKETGQRKYGHSIYRPGQDPDHSSMEAAMGDIEGQAATVVKELVQRRERAVSEHAREALAWLLALHGSAAASYGTWSTNPWASTTTT
jgi:hypothetical protein